MTHPEHPDPIQTNSLGGSDGHQALLDQFITAMGRGAYANEQGFQSPRFEELLTAITTIVIPYSHTDLRRAAQGREGLTDGKVWLIDQDVLAQKAQTLAHQDALEWFEGSLREVLAIAKGGPGDTIQAQSTRAMAAILEPIMKDKRSKWKHDLGYDSALVDEKPVLIAVDLFKDGNRTIPSYKQGRFLCMGDRNVGAQETLERLFLQHDPSAEMDAPLRQDTHSRFDTRFIHEAPRTGQYDPVRHHSKALLTFSYLGLTELFLGNLSAPERVSAGQWAEFGQQLASVIIWLPDSTKKAILQSVTDPAWLGVRELDVPGADLALSRPTAPRTFR